MDRVITANPEALLVSGMIMIGCSMVGFAAVRWPEAFYGLIGTFLP